MKTTPIKSGQEFCCFIKEERSNVFKVDCSVRWSSLPLRNQPLTANLIDSLSVLANALTPKHLHVLKFDKVSSLFICVRAATCVDSVELPIIKRNHQLLLNNR